MSRIKISIITPFYHGNEYMPAYWAMLLRNLEEISKSDLSKTLILEVLLVNDSPDESVLSWEDWLRNKTPSGFESEEMENQIADLTGFVTVRLVENPKNLGIQRSRIHGLECAGGDYIIFLDQDDILSDDAVLSFGRAVANNQESFAPKIYVANAVLEQKDWKSLWYRTDYHKRQVGNKNTYLDIGTQIISPGQCLLPKKWIPDFWIRHPLNRNGADDYFLWILLLEAGVTFSYLDKALYFHHYTAKNLSGDTSRTDASTYEFIELITRELQSAPSDSYPIGEGLTLPVRKTRKDMKRLRTMMEFKAGFRQGNKMDKMREILRHSYLFARNVLFKIQTRTGYGFNR
ncbi:MAG: glycosyltransferase [Lachnospiraceae bacterium]|nr:glycosyltransferase [Lachnospiraceae bacterium]